MLIPRYKYGYICVCIYIYNVRVSHCNNYYRQKLRMAQSKDLVKEPIISEYDVYAII